MQITAKYILMIFCSAIEVRSQEIADKAIDLLHKYEIRERQIIVRMVGTICVN